VSRVVGGEEDHLVRILGSSRGGLDELGNLHNGFDKTLHPNSLGDHNRCNGCVATVGRMVEKIEVEVHVGKDRGYTGGRPC
jgi:hypothetical protein